LPSRSKGGLTGISPFIQAANNAVLTLWPRNLSEAIAVKWLPREKPTKVILEGLTPASINKETPFCRSRINLKIILDQA
jgi:hypothetical protein